MAATIPLSSQEANTIIDNALLSAQNGGTPSVPTPDDAEESGIVPGPLPTDGNAPPPPPMTKEEKEAVRVRKAQEDLLGKEQAKALADEQARQKRREATLMGVAEKVLVHSTKAAKQANVKIGGIPTPGNLVVPLTLLLIFFFVLITYNGNTRFQWAWLTLTGNASVSATNQTSGSGSSTPHASGGPDTSVSVQDVLLSAATLTSHKGSGMYGSPF